MTLVRGIDSYKAVSYFESALKALDPKFENTYVTDRNPGSPGLDELPQSAPVYLEFNDQFSGTLNMDPAFVDEIVQKMPNLKPANQAIAELKQEGYLGFPKPDGQFGSGAFALTLPDDVAKALSMKTMLVYGRVDTGTYNDELSYLEVVTNRLTKKFIELGVEGARASLQVSNSPGLSVNKLPGKSPFVDPPPDDDVNKVFAIRLVPEPIIPNPPAKSLSADEANEIFNREPSFKILLSYTEPNEFRHPTKAQVLDAISKMPELVPASQMVGELKQAGYDGWHEVGVYPDDVYALDIAKMPNHIADENYGKLILFRIYNSSRALIEKPEEKAIQVELNNAIRAAGFDDVGIGIYGDSGPEGPNHLSVTYNGYSPPEDKVRQALASIPGISPDPTTPQSVGVPGYLSTSGDFTPAPNGVLDPNQASKLGAPGYMDISRAFYSQGTEPKAMAYEFTVDLTQFPALEPILKKHNMSKVHIYMSENVIDGW